SSRFGVRAGQGGVVPLGEPNGGAASRPDWPRPDDALRMLQTHIALRVETMTPEGMQAILHRAGGQAPHDDRVWLGLARLATLCGRLDEARQRLDACLRRRPDDPTVWWADL